VSDSLPAAAGRFSFGAMAGLSLVVFPISVFNVPCLVYITFVNFEFVLI